MQIAEILVLQFSLPYQSVSHQYYENNKRRKLYATFNIFLDGIWLRHKAVVMELRTKCEKLKFSEVCNVRSSAPIPDLTLRLLLWGRTFRCAHRSADVTSACNLGWRARRVIYGTQRHLRHVGRQIPNSSLPRISFCCAQISAGALTVRLNETCTGLRRVHVYSRVVSTNS